MSDSDSPGSVFKIFRSKLDSHIEEARKRVSKLQSLKLGNFIKNIFITLVIIVIRTL